LAAVVLVLLLVELPRLPERASALVLRRLPVV
jgi:hypothetical protein